MSGRGDSRAAAAEAIAAVLHHGRALDEALTATHHLPADPRDRALARAIAYGALRHGVELGFYRDRLLDKPLRKRDAAVDGLLIAGLHQIAHMRIPDHAAVAATVDATRALRAPRSRGLVNAILRRFQRERAELEAAAAADPAAHHNHPDWLLTRLRADWPEDWEALVAANNTPAPMTLRVNRQRQDRDRYRARLAEAGMEAAPVAVAPDALTLAEAVDVAELPGFADGAASVQDAAPQLAAPLLDPRPGERVLDACAAPGGKTAHLLEYCPDAEVVALDVDPERLGRVRETMERLGLAATVLAGDAARPDDWWDGTPFDRILIDAPCTGTGVIRRHPDIKFLRRPDDIDALRGRQAAILQASWEMLRPGGRLVYATCSVLAAENAGQMAAFVEARSDAAPTMPAADWGRVSGPGRQILPGEAGMDGFYYAVVDKIAD
ncbi:MAG: 16S rRNA (cytosine(967)-C(5))-methyltransferase RsmB [Pseudomonadota bacterium]